MTYNFDSSCYSWCSLDRSITVVSTRLLHSEVTLSFPFIINAYFVGGTLKLCILFLVGLSIYSFMYLYQYGFMFFCFVLCIIICKHHVSFEVEVVSNLANRSMFEIASVFFWQVFIVFKYFLALWHNKLFQAHHVLSLPQPWNQPFLQGMLVLFNGNKI